MTKSAGHRSRSSAAASGREPCRGVRRRAARARRGRRGRWSLPDRGRVRASRAGGRAGRPRYFEGLGAQVTGLAGAEPPRRRGRRERRRRSRVARVRLPRRRLAAAPALGAEGQRALRRAARTRYGSGAVIAASGAGATVLVRPDGRPARRRVHRRARARAGPRGLPVPRHARPTTCASARSTCSPRDAVLVGVDEQTALVRDRRRSVGGHRARAARRCTARARSSKTAKSGATVDARRRRYVSVIVTLTIVDAWCVGASVAVDGRAPRSSARRRCPSSPCRSARSRSAGCRALCAPVTMKNCESNVPSGSPSVFAAATEPTG